MRYSDFLKKLFEVFGKPDMATVRLLELSKACKDVGESISDYMNRMRLIIMRSHPDLNHKEKEQILISNIQLGLRDQKLAASLTVASITTSAGAEPKATESESARRMRKSRRRIQIISLLTIRRNSSCTELLATVPMDRKGGQNIATAFNDQQKHRGNALGGRNGTKLRGHSREFSGIGTPSRAGFKCYRYEQAGSIQKNCTQSASCTKFKPRPVECFICRASDLMRLYPKFDEMQQLATKFSPNESE